MLQRRCRCQKATGLCFADDSCRRVAHREPAAEPLHEHLGSPSPTSVRSRDAAPVAFGVELGYIRRAALVTEIQIGRLNFACGRHLSIDIRHGSGGSEMAPAPERTQRGQCARKPPSTTFVQGVCNPKAPDEKHTDRSPTTSTGLPVEDQVRKEWDPRKGALPTLCR